MPFKGQDVQLAKTAALLLRRTSVAHKYTYARVVEHLIIVQQSNARPSSLRAVRGLGLLGGLTKLITTVFYFFKCAQARL